MLAGKDKEEVKKLPFFASLSEVKIDDNAYDVFSFDLEEFPEDEVLANLLKEILDNIVFDPYFPNNNERRDLEEKLRYFYEENDHHLAWTTSRGITTQGKELFEAINNVSEDGLNPDHYSPGKMEELFEKLQNVK